MAEACGVISDLPEKKRTELYEKLLHIAKRKTAEADVKFDDRGKKRTEEEAEDFGDNVLIVNPEPDGA